MIKSIRSIEDAIDMFWEGGSFFLFENLSKEEFCKKVEEFDVKIRKPRRSKKEDRS